MRTRKVHQYLVLVNLVLAFSSLVLGQSVGDSDEQEPRESRQFENESEQKYEFELSFPVDSDEATNVVSGKRERIESLLQSILLENKSLDVDDTLPGTILDPNSISFAQSFRCNAGEVVVDDQCVPCPPGTFFDEAQSVCTKCPIGQFNLDSAQRECVRCPTILGIEGVTESVGATSSAECKEMCNPGHYYDKVTDLCRPCGHGRFQQEAGKFTCDLCPVGLTTRTKKAISDDECRPDCNDGEQLGLDETCNMCPVGTYRTQGIHRGCQDCPAGRTTNKAGSVSISDCSLPICLPGEFLSAKDNSCVLCPLGQYQPDSQQTSCVTCPPDTSTIETGATSVDQCSNRCKVSKGEPELCDRNARCQFKPPNDFTCTCKLGYNGTGIGDNSCVDMCEGFCKNDGICLRTSLGQPYCQCAGSFAGKQCEEKSEFAYIAGGIAGAVLFVILLVLLIWMIFVRSNKSKRFNEKFLQQAAGDMAGSQVNFYYGAPAPYAESIAPSQHGSTYAHYYEDEEDGWGMPNFYDTYGKNSKMARSNGSLYNAGMYGPQYAPQGELYDRLGRHAYQPRPEDKSGNDTTSESEDDRSRRPNELI